jgi:antitoxin (DNA-binding transcriptional repressor) of toxin-antitoxin stability system
MKATMHEAKTSLSKLVARARAGEEVVLTHGRAQTPVARIVAIDPAEAPVLKERPIGLFKAEMGDFSDYDWSEPMSKEELALWEAPIVSTWADNDGTPKSDK